MSALICMLSLMLTSASAGLMIDSRHESTIVVRLTAFELDVENGSQICRVAVLLKNEGKEDLRVRRSEVSSGMVANLRLWRVDSQECYALLAVTPPPTLSMLEPLTLQAGASQPYEFAIRLRPQAFGVYTGGRKWEPRTTLPIDSTYAVDAVFDVRYSSGDGNAEHRKSISTENKLWIKT